MTGGARYAVEYVTDWGIADYHRISSIVSQHMNYHSNFLFLSSFFCSVLLGIERFVLSCGGRKKERLLIKFATYYIYILGWWCKELDNAECKTFTSTPRYPQ